MSECVVTSATEPYEMKFSEIWLHSYHRPIASTLGELHPLKLVTLAMFKRLKFLLRLLKQVIPVFVKL
jgi:hypothetical protein